MQLELEAAWVDADPDRLDQIVTNLLHNAIKYTAPDGTIRIETPTRTTSVLRVTDSGCGIEPKFLPRVFDLFAQGAQRPDRPHGGLGVGLTLVRRIVEIHGARSRAQRRARPRQHVRRAAAARRTSANRRHERTALGRASGARRIAF